MDDIAMKIEGVNKTFRLPHEKRTSIKGSVINLFRKQTYEKQEALKDISFEVKKGEFFGIVGRNGSGKSTLLKLLAGIYSPDEGLININGSLTPFIELGVGFSPELTGRENVFLNGALLGFKRKEMSAMYDSIVEFAELERFMDQKLKNYSSGMQVRLAFSIAIRATSNILLLDEVLAVGDAAFQQKCYNHFEELKRQKTTVIFVSHDMGAVRRFCNRAVYIDKGLLVHEGTPADIADIYAEANINVEKEEVKLPNTHSIKASVVSQNKHELTFRVVYKSKDKERMYIGFSVVKDGISIAEMSTHPDKPLIGNGEVTYTLDLSTLNPGLYQLSGISLFTWHNRELMAINKGTTEIIIKGTDITRAGAIKLADTWVYEN